MRLVTRLTHTRVVHAIAWRWPRVGHAPRPVLAVITSNRAAYIYSPVLDEPHALRQWAAVDPAIDLGLETTSKPVALMYCDAYRLSVALQHDMDQLAHAEQRAKAGVAGAAHEDVERSRRHRIQQLLDHAPDVFLALLTDGSVAVYALMNVESSSPVLWQTYIVLQLPQSVAVEPSAAPTQLQFVPLAYGGAPPKGEMMPTALIHAQSANGMRGAAAVSMALLLDGDQRGLFVQDTLLTNERDAPTVPTSGAPVRFLRAEHKTDIVALHPTHSGHALVSLSLDGVLIGWHLHERGHAALLSEHRVRLRGATAATVLRTDAHAAMLVEGRIALVAMSPSSGGGGASSYATTDMSVETEPLPSTITEEALLTFTSVQRTDGTYVIVACTRDARVCVWPIASGPETCHLEAPDVLQLEKEVPPELRAAAVLDTLQLGAYAGPALCTVDTHGELVVWDLEGHAHLRMPTAHTDARALAASRTGHLALAAWEGGAWHVSVWDVMRAPFASARVHGAEVPGDAAHCPALAWSVPERGGALLAIGAEASVQIWAPCTPSAGVGSRGAMWAPLAQVNLEEGGTGTVSHVAWLAGERLLVASTCQLFLYAAGTDAHDVAHWLPVLAAEHAALLPPYHPRHLQYCVQMRLLDAAHTIVRDLRRAMASSLYSPDAVADCSVAWDTYLVRAPPDTQGTNAVPDEQIAELVGTLGERRAPGLSDADTRQLRAVLASFRATLAEPVDECGRLFLTYLDAAFAEEPAPAPTLPPGAMLFWAQHSATQEILVGRVLAACGQSMAWPQLCTSGVFAWSRDRATLLPLMEQAARVAYTAGDDIDPVQSTLFYLALRRETTVRSIWRRAHGHPDQAKMNRFLANDFTVERWRIAAQKNAFALISQRRFDFAAAFFLLGDALQDAVNVCVRNLRNVPLAVAIARVYEEEDCGPVFRRLLERHIVPHAVERGDRWLACWALSVLQEHDAAMRVVEVGTRLTQTPLRVFAEDARHAPWHVADVECVGADAPDPALALAVEYARQRGWASVANEPTFVALCARRWQEMGTWLC